jgi:hypothetical protein
MTDHGDMPDEMLEHMYRDLNTKDLLSLRLSSKRQRDIVDYILRRRHADFFGENTNIPIKRIIGDLMAPYHDLKKMVHGNIYRKTRAKTKVPLSAKQEEGFMAHFLEARILSLHRIDSSVNNNSGMTIVADGFVYSLVFKTPLDINPQPPGRWAPHNMQDRLVSPIFAQFGRWLGTYLMRMRHLEELTMISAGKTSVTNMSHWRALHKAQAKLKPKPKPKPKPKRKVVKRKKVIAQPQQVEGASNSKSPVKKIIRKESSLSKPQQIEAKPVPKKKVIRKKKIKKIKPPPELAAILAEAAMTSDQQGEAP